MVGDPGESRGESDRPRETASGGKDHRIDRIRRHSASAFPTRRLGNYYGWYSNKARGMRQKVAEAAAAAEEAAADDRDPQAGAPTVPAARATAARFRPPPEPDLGHAHQAGLRD